MVPVMTIGADGFIYGFSQAVNTPNRLVLGQGVPRVEGKIVTEQILFAAIEVLSWQVNICHCFKGRDGLVPLHAGVFDRHVVSRVLSLYLQGETGGHTVQGQLLIKGITQEVR